MDIVQMANDFVLGLQRLGNFFEGYEALTKTIGFISDGRFAQKLDGWNAFASDALSLGLSSS